MSFMLIFIIARRSFHSARFVQAKKAVSSSFNAENAAQQLGISFQTPHILQQALTHKSFEHGSVPSNERLAQLGSRVIQLFATESVTSSTTNASSSLEEQVKNKTSLEVLSRNFDDLKLSDGLQFELPSESASTKVKATAFNAVVGAVYHDQGFSKARDFVKKHLQ
ncbi:ribonuclease-III-like-domain-containing protein [Dichotomocladium elegans]|nr:ribonuclease-III-like-domain-containing protein [Dichotomocladium elegans]